MVSHEALIILQWTTKRTHPKKSLPVYLKYITIYLQKILKLHNFVTVSCLYIHVCLKIQLCLKMIFYLCWIYRDTLKQPASVCMEFELYRLKWRKLPVSISSETFFSQQCELSGLVDMALHFPQRHQSRFPFLSFLASFVCIAEN